MNHSVPVLLAILLFVESPF